jgi:hypothetical protein
LALRADGCLAAAGARVVTGYNKGADRAAALIAELGGSDHRAIYLAMDSRSRSVLRHHPSDLHY